MACVHKLGEVDIGNVQATLEMAYVLYASDVNQRKAA